MTKPPKSSSPLAEACKPISMALWNIRSLTTKTFIVNDLISEGRLDCLFLTETWLNENGPASLIEASPPDYGFSYSLRKAMRKKGKKAKRKRGGGTASIFSEGLGCTNISFDEFSSFEYHALSMKCRLGDMQSNQTQILAVTVYRAPRSTNFQNEFTEFLSIIHANFDRCIISGDFNLHVDLVHPGVLTNSQAREAKEFLDMLTSMDFTQHITEPTHKRGHTLDLVITKGLSIAVTSVLVHPNSDHSCIFFTINASRIENGADRVVKRRQITPAVAEEFMAKMRTPAEGVTPVDGDLVTTFTTKIRTTLDSLAPLQIKRTRSKQKAPWINSDIRKLKRACRRAERAWRKSKLHVHLDIFKEHLGAFNNAIR